jgi:hypothetical protein
MSKHTIIESISDKPSINAQIEKLLAKHDPAAQTRLLDALEALKNAGPDGLSPTDWAAAVKLLHSEGDYSMKDLLTTAAKEFKCCVRRIGAGMYAWDDSDRELGDLPPGLDAAMHGSIQLSDIGMKAMEELGEFTIGELAAKISAKTGMPQQQAAAFAEHLVQQFMGGTITSTGDGKFKVNVEQPKTSANHMDDLKSLLRNAGLGPKD